MIATPMYGGLCTSNYVSSLLDNVFDLLKNQVIISWYFISNESLIQRARNHAVNAFLQNTDASHLMFIDADIDFPSGSIQKLLDLDKEVAVGLYPKKNLNKKLVVNGLVGNTCKHAGTGFMLISRQVFEKLGPHLPKVRDSDDSAPYTQYFTCETDSAGLYLSEDWWFCNKCIENNIEINVDLSIELKHIGNYEYIGPQPEVNNGHKY
jgi:hypothetical protein